MPPIEHLHYFFRQGFTASRPYNDTCNFTFHINTASYPINHSHLDYWEFTIVTKGEVVNCRNKKKECFQKNTIFVSPTNEEHYLLTANQSPTEYINIPVRESYLLAILNLLSPNLQEFLLKNRHVSISDYTVFRIQKILNSTAKNIRNNVASHDKLLLNAFLIIIQKFFNVYLQKTQTEDLPNWLVKMQEIIDNEDPPIFSVSQLSEKLNYTRGHFTKLFKAYFKSSPTQYLFELKMSYAKNLLTNTDLSITDISEKISYSHVSQFCKVFKEHFQYTPNEFRQKYKAYKHEF